MTNNVFTKEEVEILEKRINNLTKSSAGLWGKMSVSQMLAHCNVQYEMVFDDIHKKPSAVMKFILKIIVKSKVVSDKPYSKNGQTAPQFVIREDKDFDVEKGRLIGYLYKVQELGVTHFDSKESHSFGALSTDEWNNLFYKHLDHHLKQFGV